MEKISKYEESMQIYKLDETQIMSIIKQMSKLKKKRENKEKKLLRLILKLVLD